MRVVILTNKQYVAGLVVDVDKPGTRGGYPSNLDGYVKIVTSALIDRGIRPSWVGINPTNGKYQMIWLIDPVYADASGHSPHMKLLAATTRALGKLLDRDPHFAHRFSRSPLYDGDSPHAYRWYCQHHRVIRLGDVINQVRELAGQPRYRPTPRQQFTSRRELINAVKTRREEAQAFKALAGDVEAEISGKLEAYDSELIQGVRIYWIGQGQARAARDEAAFRHALKTAHRLHAQGQSMTDAAIIDAYEHAYNVAHKLGADSRPN